MGGIKCEYHLLSLSYGVVAQVEDLILPMVEQVIETDRATWFESRLHHKGKQRSSSTTSWESSDSRVHTKDRLTFLIVLS